MSELTRTELEVTGTVQGVGFRPFVFRLARELGLAGSVRNDHGGVRIEVEGSTDNVLLFRSRLTAEAPPLACLDAVRCRPLPYRGDDRFTIEATDAGGAVGFPRGTPVGVPPDVRGVR